MKQRLLASSSGGRTSMFQLEWLLENKQDTHEIIGVFANTGWEHPKTLEFTQKCTERWKQKFDFDFVWVESVPVYGKRVSCKHKVVNYETASRNMEPFRAIVKKYGVPNVTFKHCTRALKENPIHDYIKTRWPGPTNMYETAIGIRIDEPQRLHFSVKQGPYDIVYPLVEWHPDMPDKEYILEWWSKQDFDLGLPEHLGNCVGCYKKSTKKLLKAIRDERELFKMNTLEQDFGNVGPNKVNGQLVDLPRAMYRKFMTAQGLLDLYDTVSPESLAGDEHSDEDAGCSSSCEPFNNQEDEDNDR